MWTHPLTIALVAGTLAGIVGSLLTIFLAPRIQHSFWKRQRSEELRLAAINDFNRLTNDFLAWELYRHPISRPEWFAAMNTAAATIGVLFSHQAWLAVQAVDHMIKPGLVLDPTERGKFVEARDAALRALYREVIPLPRGD